MDYIEQYVKPIDPEIAEALYEEEKEQQIRLIAQKTLYHVQLCCTRFSFY